MPGPPYHVGVNLAALFQGDDTWDSPDVIACARGPNLYGSHGGVQTTLAVDYVAGSEVMQLTGPNPFAAGTPHGATPATSGFLSTVSGNITVNFTAVGGINNLYITSWNNPAFDVDYPAGTLINSASGAWVNTSLTSTDWPLNAQFMDGTRPTGYPTGLNNGQKFLIAVTGYSSSQAGVYTIQARGTGTVQVVIANWITGAFTTFNIGVVAGVPAGTVTMPANSHVYQVWITASSVSDPLYNVRIIMPDRVGHTDNFVATYAAQAANPYFFLPHPDLVNSLKPFSTVRLMNAMGTNSNGTVYTWDARPIYNGVGPGIVGIIPYEYWAALINAVGCEVWVCIPTNALPDYISSFASWLLANINGKVLVEWSNEVWNGGFTQSANAAYRGVTLYNPSVVQSVTYAGGVATVTMAGHGFATGNSIQICNAADDNYNGAYPITVTGTGTFTYVPSVAPTTSPAVPITFHALMALNTASTFMRSIASATWDGLGTITVNTTTAHGAASGDIWQICNLSDPTFDGLWVVTLNGPTVLVIAINTFDEWNRTMPVNPPPGAVTFVPKAGQSLSCYRVGNANFTGTIPGLSQVQLNIPLFMANLVADIHSTFHATFAAAGQLSRLGCCLMWQMPFGAATWNFTKTVDFYLTRLGLGNTFLPGCETAIGAAPYFIQNATSTATFRGATQAIASANLTFSGGTATVVLANHGYLTGDNVAICNAVDIPYNGIFAITKVDANTFTYPVVGTPPSPAHIANGSAFGGLTIFCVKDPPYARELTAVTVSGSTMTCTSKGHGWSTGLVVNLCPGTYGRSQYLPYPAIFGQFIITVIDSDTFSVQINAAGYYTLPGNNSRMWAWASSAIDVLCADLNTFTKILAQSFAGVTWAQSTHYPAATIRCYEGGMDNLIFGDAKYPALQNLQAVTQNSVQFAAVYKQYLNLLYNKYNAVEMTQYQHIAVWGSNFYGIKEFQHEINNPWWDMLMSVCSGTPDYTDDGTFPGFLSLTPQAGATGGAAALMLGT